MQKLGMLHLPFMEPLVAAHLHPRSAAASSSLPAYSPPLSIPDLCLRIQHGAFKATGKMMATLVLQEHARWKTCQTERRMTC